MFGNWLVKTIKYTIIIHSKDTSLRFFLFVMTLGAMVYLGNFIIRFGTESLQMDFAAFYTAGEAISSGLSPYVNHVTLNPPIWDGVDVFQHSRFLYPPLAAYFFRLIAFLPYAIAKYVWMMLNTVSILISEFVIIDMINPKKRLEWLLGLTVFISTSYPLLTLLERGQIDGITLLLVTLSIRLMLGGVGSQADLLAGFLWAFATLLKLHCVYIVPFLLIRGKLKVFFGYVLSIIGIIFLSLIVNPNLSVDYIQRELPRIARFGEGGDERMKLPSNVIQDRLVSLPQGYTIKDGIVYRTESMKFISNASLARSMAAILWRIGFNIPASILSVLTFIVLFFGFYIWQFRRGIPNGFKAIHELIYWEIVLIIILLSAPLTWAMNIVWIFPFASSLIYGCAVLRGRIRILILNLGISGLFIAWAPDSLVMLLFGSHFVQLANAKYLFSQTALLLSLVLLLEGIRRSQPYRFKSIGS